jgi:hypothetical protein
MNNQLDVKAAELIREMRGWAKHEPKGGLADCLAETADLLEAMLEERRTIEVFITEREWLHREG